MPKVIEVPGQGLVEFPDSMSDAQISQAIQSQLITPATSVFQPKVPYSGAVESTRAAAQGLTFGFADELEAALRSGAVSGKEYESIRDRLRAQQGQYNIDNPGFSTPLELLGGMAMPLGALKALKGTSGATQAAVTGETIGGQIARGTGVGAATGALTGAGTAEKNTLESSAIGGAVGGVLGGTLPVAIKGAGSMIRGALNAAGIGDQTTAANKILANTLNKDNLTPDEAQAALAELQRLNVPRPVLADISKSLQDLSYAAYVVPSGEKAATARFLESRMIDQPSDIVSGLVKRAGLGKNVNGYEYLDFLAQNQQSAASAKYPLAYSKAVDARDFRKYVDRPVFQDAYREAQRRAGVYGDTLPDLDQIRNAQFVPTNVLHQIKIGLDRVVEKEIDPVTGKMTSYGRDVSNVKREFNDLIKEKNEFYKKANQEFADNERIRSSFESGQKYQKMEYKEVLDDLKKMNDSEKEAFRLGMMSDVNSRLENFKGGDFTRQIFKSDKQRSLLRYAFTDSNQYNDFVRYVDALSNQTKTGKSIMGGSQTGERLATSEALGNTAAVAQSLATGGLTGGAMQLLRQGAARAKGISGETSAELQKRLFATDPIEQARILQELKLRTQRKPVGLVPGSAAIGTTTGLLGD
jgi:hypothetical protein